MLKNLTIKLWYLRGSAEAADLETKGSGEMELQAAVQAYMLVSCKTTLHSLSLLYSGQIRDPKGVIQGTHFLDGKLLAKPQSSVLMCWCPMYFGVIGTADMKLVRQKVVA